MGFGRVRASDFPLGGQLILFAIRHWVRAYRLGHMVPVCAWQSFSVADLDGAYAELCRLLRIVAFRELDVDAVRSPGARGLSEAECRFMRCFEQAERHGSGAIEETVVEMASPAVAREIVASVERIVAELAARGHRVARPRAVVSERRTWRPATAGLASQH